MKPRNAIADVYFRMVCERKQKNYSNVFKKALMD